MNGPVGPMVWNVVSNIGLSEDLLDSMKTVQARNYLSAGNNLITNKIFYGHQLEELYFEKLNRFMNDTTENSIDSVLNLLNEGVIPNSDLMKADVYYSMGDIENLNMQLKVIADKGGFFSDYASLKTLLWRVSTSNDSLELVKADTDMYSAIQSQAYSGSYLTEGLARTLLYKVWGVYTPEEKPVPNSGGGGVGKTANNPKTPTKQTIRLSNYVKLYPNPVTDKLHVEVENNDATDITVCNINGLVLIKHNLASGQDIDMSSLPNGIYLVNLINKKIIVATKKIVVIK